MSVACGAPASRKIVRMALKTTTTSSRLKRVMAIDYVYAKYSSSGVLLFLMLKRSKTNHRANPEAKTKKTNKKGKEQEEQQNNKEQHKEQEDKKTNKSYQEEQQQRKATQKKTKQEEHGRLPGPRTLGFFAEPRNSGGHLLSPGPVCSELSAWACSQHWETKLRRLKRHGGKGHRILFPLNRWLMTIISPFCWFKVVDFTSVVFQTVTRRSCSSLWSKLFLLGGI